MSNLPYRPNACLLIINLEGKLFLGERDGNPGVWQFPQGGIESDGSEEENVLRELHEELGAPQELFSIIKKLYHTHRYDWIKPPDYAVGKWRGQDQSFWLVRFVGKDSDIKLDLYDQELQDFKWVSLKEVRALAQPRRLKGYEGALKELEQMNLVQL